MKVVFLVFLVLSGWGYAADGEEVFSDLTKIEKIEPFGTAYCNYWTSKRFDCTPITDGVLTQTENGYNEWYIGYVVYGHSVSQM